MPRPRREGTVTMAWMTPTTSNGPGSEPLDPAGSGDGAGGGCSPVVEQAGLTEDEFTALL